MEKIYCGNAKIVTTQFGDIWKVSQSRTDLEKLLKYMNDNDTEWVNLDIKEKPTKVEGKPTHYLQVYQPNAKNDFKPAKEKNDWVPVVAEKKIIDKYENDGERLPF